MTTSPSVRTEPAKGASAYIVAQDDVQLYWPGIAAYLQKTPDKGILEYRDLPDVFDVIVNDPNYYLWVAVDEGQFVGMALCAVVRTSKDATLWVEAINFDNFLRDHVLLEEIEKWATFQGVEWMKFYGPAAYKKLKPDYDAKQILYQKNIRKAWSN